MTSRRTNDRRRAGASVESASRPDWKWVPGRTPQLPEPFTIEKLVGALMDEGGVDRAVVVPPSWPGDRNDYAPRSSPGAIRSASP